MNTKIITIKNFTAFLIILLSLTACSSNKSRPTPKKSEAASFNARLGAEYTRKGRLNLANEKLLKALDQPNFASALYQMAKIKFEQGDYTRAQAFLQRYHERNPEVAESLALCVQINSHLGDLNAAGQCKSKLAGRFQS